MCIRDSLHDGGGDGVPLAGDDALGLSLIHISPYLDGLDTVCGQVVDGMDVVDAINAVETDENSRPLEDVTVLSVTVTTFGQAGAIAAESAPESAA